MIRHVHLHTVTRQRLLHPRLDLGGHIHRAGWRRERLLRERCRSLPGGRLWLGWLVYAPLPKAEARELRTHVPRRVQLLVLLERAVYGLLGKRAEHESLDAFECVADGTADNGIGYSGRSSEDRPTHTADHPRHGFHPLRLLLCIDGLGDCADNLERWARRLGLISGRPLGARHDGRILPKVGCSVSVEDLQWVCDQRHIERTTWMRAADRRVVGGTKPVAVAASARERKACGAGDVTLSLWSFS
mmetsp:Transcript_14086/g.42972  ORF Transcript_14086/g.42972 Transcript_14086/m.42972 type:complete len:245 (+) Transcript_14086:959-1693(+)